MTDMRPVREDLSPEALPRSTEEPPEFSTRAGLLASGSIYRPLLPMPIDVLGPLRPRSQSVTVDDAAFVPGYSGGTATELHRLPYSPGWRQAPEHPGWEGDGIGAGEEVNVQPEASDRRG